MPKMPPVLSGKQVIRRLEDLGFQKVGKGGLTMRIYTEKRLKISTIAAKVLLCILGVILFLAAIINPLWLIAAIWVSCIPADEKKHCASRSRACQGGCFYGIIFSYKR
jgi:predicted RNA binding protein YcfA (HicA-like mRNA interferase family)